MTHLHDLEVALTFILSYITMKDIKEVKKQMKTKLSTIAADFMLLLNIYVNLFFLLFLQQLSNFKCLDIIINALRKRFLILLENK